MLEVSGPEPSTELQSGTNYTTINSPSTFQGPASSEAGRGPSFSGYWLLLWIPLKMGATHGHTGDPACLLCHCIVAMVNGGKCKKKQDWGANLLIVLFLIVGAVIYLCSLQFRQWTTRFSD